MTEEEKVHSDWWKSKYPNQDMFSALWINPYSYSLEAWLASRKELREENERLKREIARLRGESPDAGYESLKREDTVTIQSDVSLSLKYPETKVELIKYNELLMAVSRKFPGESRHETALRYLREAEIREVEVME